MTDIIINDESWLEAGGISDDIGQYITKIVRTTVEQEGKYNYNSIDMACLLTNDKEIQELNLRFRNKNSPTNVLSFPNDADIAGEGGITHIGDIVISLDTIKREAEEQSKILKNHLAHMVIHGTLHLLGYDHIETEDAEIMEAKEIEILSIFNIENPYIIDS